MKKCMFIFMLVISCLLLFGCNQEIFDTNYTFNYAYVTVGNKVIEGKVDKWKDYDDCDLIQVRFENGEIYYTHASNIILCKVEDK